MTRLAPEDAINRPVKRQYTRRELHSDDMPPRALDALTDEDGTDRSADIIIADADMAAKDYLDELKFAEDVLTVVLHRGREKNAPMYEMFGVNGKTIWIQVDTPTKVRRKYVEVMARSMPMNIETDSGEVNGDAMTYNVTHRTLSSGYSFSIIEDPSPKGAAWLAKVRRES